STGRGPPRTRARCSRSACGDPQASRSDRETGLDESARRRLTARGLQGALAVDALDRETAEAALADGAGEGGSGPREADGVVGEGEDRAPAALHEQREVAVREHHDGARLTSRPVRGGPSVRTGALGALVRTVTRGLVGRPGRPRE